jgi:hypothetical protein
LPLSVQLISTLPAAPLAELPVNAQFFSVLLFAPPPDQAAEFPLKVHLSSVQ